MAFFLVANGCSSNFHSSYFQRYWEISIFPVSVVNTVTKFSLAGLAWNLYPALSHSLQLERSEKQSYQGVFGWPELSWEQVHPPYQMSWWWLQAVRFLQGWGRRWPVHHGGGPFSWASFYSSEYNNWIIKTWKLRNLLYTLEILSLFLYKFMMS